MKIEGANFAEREASAEAIRELMADDGKRGAYMILMQEGDEEAFVQIAFDDHPDGIDLEYREGAGTPIFHCTRPVSRAEAERALLEYFAGWKTWKNRFPWEKLKGGASPKKAGGKNRVEAILDFVWAAMVVCAVAWVWKDSKWLGGKGTGAGSYVWWVGLTVVWAMRTAIRVGGQIGKRKKGTGGAGGTGGMGEKDAKDGEGGTEAARQNGNGGGKRES